MRHELVSKVLAHVSTTDIAKFRDARLETVTGLDVKSQQVT